MLYTISKEKIEMEKFYVELISSMMLYNVTLKEKKKNCAVCLSTSRHYDISFYEIENMINA